MSELLNNRIDYVNMNQLINKLEKAFNDAKIMGYTIDDNVKNIILNFDEELFRKKGDYLDIDTIIGALFRNLFKSKDIKTELILSIKNYIIEIYNNNLGYFISNNLKEFIIGEILKYINKGISSPLKRSINFQVIISDYEIITKDYLFDEEIQILDNLINNIMINLLDDSELNGNILPTLFNNLNNKI